VYNIPFIVLCGAFVIQLIYILYFFIPFVFEKDSQEVLPNNTGISVVISAWDELENLKVLIPKILSQNHSNFDLIIVDDRSMDGSIDYLREIAKLDNRIKHIRIDETPDGMSAKKYALTLAIKASKHERIVFTDADSYPESTEWLNTINNAYINANTQVVLGYSKYEKAAGFLNTFIRFETSFTALQYFSFAFKKLPYMGVGRNLSYTKSIFLNNNGFQPFMSFLAGDDDLFVQKVATNTNTNFVTNHSSHTVSKPKQNWSEYFTQKIRHLNTGKFYKTKSKSLLGLLFLSTLIFYICVCLTMANSSYIYYSLGLFLVRHIFISVIFYKLSIKLNDKQEWYLVPFLEIVYIFYYLGVGIIS
jgi:glycosyltransferase involved in cell wall biosynthesis